MSGHVLSDLQTEPKARVVCLIQHERKNVRILTVVFLEIIQKKVILTEEIEEKVYANLQIMRILYIWIQSLIKHRFLLNFLHELSSFTNSRYIQHFNILTSPVLRIS